MKKILILLLTVVVIASMGFAGISCKVEEAVEEAVEEEAPAEVREIFIAFEVDNLDGG